MQALHELAYLVARSKLTPFEVFGKNSSDNKFNLAEFYEGLLANRFTTDDQAASHFFGTGKKDPRYQKLKNNLKNHLISVVLFFIDSRQSSYTARQRAYYESHKDWASVKILMGKNAHVAGVGLCQKILRQAKKFEFTDLALDVARILRLHWGTTGGDLKKFEQYKELYRHYEKINQVEDLAEELYTELIIRYVNNKATKTEIHKKASEYYDRLKDALEEFDTYRLHLSGSLIKTIIHTSINDYKSAIKVCDETISFFEAKDYLANVPLQICYYQQLVCHTQLKQYEKGKIVAEKCLALLEKGSFNWFKYQELFFILSMHTRKYQQAYTIFSETVSHKKYKSQPPNITETWMIFEAFIHYLVDIKKIVPKQGDKRFNKFRLGKFLNATPLFSKDKRGMNIPIMTIQILFMVSGKKYDEAMNRIEAVEKYCTRYLRKDDTFRSNCFIRMLLQIPKSGFHKSAVVRQAAKYLAKLESVPLEIANQAHGIEIIPYEDLWEMATNSLESSFRRVRSVNSVKKEAVEVKN